jgi:hypothetical protein
MPVTTLAVPTAMPSISPTAVFGAASVSTRKIGSSG